MKLSAEGKGMTLPTRAAEQGDTEAPLTILDNRR